MEVSQKKPAAGEILVARIVKIARSVEIVVMCETEGMNVNTEALTENLKKVRLKNCLTRHFCRETSEIRPKTRQAIGQRRIGATVLRKMWALSHRNDRS